MRYLFVAFTIGIMIYLFFKVLGGIIQFFGGGKRGSSTGRSNIDPDNMRGKGTPKKINPEDIVEADFEEIEIDEEKKS